RLKDLLDSRTAERKKLEGETPPNYEKLYAAMSEEAKLLTYFDKPKEAKELGERAAKLKEELDTKRLTAAVEAGVASGQIDQEALFFSKYEEGGGKKLEYYAAVRHEGGKAKLELKDTFYALKPPHQQRILKALLKSGQRMDVVKGMRQAKGPLKGFFQAQLDLVDGDKAAAKTKLEQFIQEAKGSKDPKVKPFLKEAERILAAFKAGEGKDEAQIMGEVRALLGPLVMSVNMGSDGSLDLSKISKEEIKSFDDFRNYLANQVSVDGVSFNAVWFASYEKVLNSPKHEVLLKHLYAQFNPDAKKDLPKISPEKLQELFIDFQKDFVDVSHSRFVGSHINTKAGRNRLRNILRDPLHYDVAFRANLLEEIVDTADHRGYLPRHLRSKFEDQISTYTFLTGKTDDPSTWGVSVTGEQIKNATQIGFKILAIADHKEGDRAIQVEAYERYPHEVQRLNSGELNRKVTPQRIKAMAQLVGDRGDKTDGISMMEARLGNFWLTLIDNKNWSPEFTAKFVSAEQRAAMVNKVEGFLAEAKNIKTEKEFLEWSLRIRRYLRGEGSGSKDDAASYAAAGAEYVLGEGAGKEISSVVSAGVGLTKGMVTDYPDDLLEGMSPIVDSGYTDLLQFTDEVWAADNMGLNVQVLDPELSLPDPAQKKLAAKLIRDLRGAQRSFWYQYKQRNLLSRGLSQGAEEVGFGDVEAIRRGNREINDIIRMVESAKTKADLEKVKARLTKATKAGGAISAAYAGCEMDGTQQMINFAEIIGEIVIISIATRGMGTEAAMARG
ncbi:MAG: hypothetical protein R3257_05165, partial [bacterium]|nr:hypothetical protein [bacterium]